MDNYLSSNKEMWNEWATQHAKSDFYDVNGFIRGRNTLTSLELEEMGDVKGKAILHLMCHFGLDTLSWERMGATVTGVDFSENAIDIARDLSKEAGLEAEFVCSDLYELPKKLKGKFDIVYTSSGVLCWLPDLTKWGSVIAQFLKRGGFFYIMESHPFHYMLLSDDLEQKQPELLNSYFHAPEPDIYPNDSSYAGAKTSKQHMSHEWTHSLSDIINALISAGLRIDFLHEFPKLFFQGIPYMVKDDEGWWRIPGDKFPLLFSLKATKP